MIRCPRCNTTIPGNGRAETRIEVCKPCRTAEPVYTAEVRRRIREELKLSSPALEGEALDAATETAFQTYMAAVS